MRRLWAVLAAFVLLVGLLQVWPATVVPAHAAPAPPVATPATPITGETFTVSGKLSTKVVRPVELQTKVGKKWKKLSNGKTDKTGRYSLTGTTTKASVTVRVVAKKTKVKGHTYKAVTTKSRVIRTTGRQTATLSMPAAVEVNGQVNASLTFTPVRTGRPVQVQALVSGSWTKIADGFETAKGTSTIQLTATTIGNYIYRAMAPAWHGAAAVASSQVGVTVKPSQVVTKDVHPITNAELATLDNYDAATGTLVFTGVPASLADVKVGTVITLPPRDGAPSGALRRVTKVETSGSTTTISTAAAALTDAFARIPDTSSEVGLSATSATFTPSSEDGVSVDVLSTPSASGAVKGAGMRAAALNVLSLKFGFDLTIADHYRWAADGSVSLSLVSDCSFEVDLSGLKSYRIGAGIQVANSFTSRVSAKFAAKPKPVSLGKLTEIYGGSVGPVPFWMEADLEILLEFGVDGQLGVVTRTTQTGTSRGGIEGDRNSDLAPRLYSSQAPSQSEITQASVTGTGTAFLGGEIGLFLYSAVGPYARLGAQAKVDIEIPLTNTSPRTCKLTYGPHAELGIKPSATLSSILGVTFTAGVKVDFLSMTSDLCPSDTGGDDGGGEALAVSSIEIPDGATNHAYSAQLTATGGTPAYTWASADLPGWLTLDPATGQLSGTPISAGEATFSVSVTDTAGTSASQLLTLSVTEATTATSIDVGQWHGCAVTAEATVRCWGYNRWGQLGNGKTTDSAVAVAVKGLSHATAVAVGDAHSCALTDAGVVKCWGSGTSGGLGDGQGDDSLVPVTVNGLTDVRQISAGGFNTCAVTAAEELWCWGANWGGQIGDGTTDDRLTPYKVDLAGVSAVSAGTTTCAVISEDVKCWGGNESGTLGVGTRESSSVPLDVPGLSGVTQIATGDMATCALTSGGSTYCWGHNYYGSLGTGSAYNELLPAVVPGPALKQIATGTLECGLDDSGSAYCWGYGYLGALGDGSILQTRTSPTPVLDGQDFTQIAVGSGVSCALKKTGAVYCWGSNDYNNLGDGTSHWSATPVGVAGLSG